MIWRIISVGQRQMLFKLFGKNRWAIWSCCFGSTKCHPCSLVSGMPHLKNVLAFLLPRLSLNSWSQVHLEASFFSGYNLILVTFITPKQFQISHRFWPTNLNSIWNCPTVLTWWSELNKTAKGSFFEAPCIVLVSLAYGQMKVWLLWFVWTIV